MNRKINNRILDLAEQAGSTHKLNLGVYQFYEPELKQFAELIVRECTSSLMTPKYIMNHPEELSEFNRGWVNGRLSGIEDIREHFGVKEREVPEVSAADRSLFTGIGSSNEFTSNGAAKHFGVK